MAFKVSKQQLAECQVLAADLRRKAAVLNSAIVAFNHAIAPLSRAVGEAMDDYNTTLEIARTLTGRIAEAAREEFDAKSARWQASDKGIPVRVWIEQWEMSLDDVDLDLPEPIAEIDPDEHAEELEDGPPAPTD